MRRAQRRRRRGGQFGQTFRRTSIEASPYRARAPRHPGASRHPCEEGNALHPYITVITKSGNPKPRPRQSRLRLRTS